MTAVIIKDKDNGNVSIHLFDDYNEARDFASRQFVFHNVVDIIEKIKNIHLWNK